MNVLPLSFALAWAALVMAGAVRFRPPPPRVRALTPARQALPSRPRRPPLVERLGAVVLTVPRRVGSGRPTPPDGLRARQAGTAVVAAAPFLVVLPAASPAAAVVGWAWPRLRATRAERQRQRVLASGLPEVVDLLLLAVGAGLTVPLALQAVARRAQSALSHELQRVLDEAALGRRLADALDELPARAGEATRPLVAALVASERYGAPLTGGLERLADEVRRQRRRRAEEAARRVPVKLLFPLVTCTLPAFGLLTVAPLIAGALRSLRL